MKPSSNNNNNTNNNNNNNNDDDDHDDGKRRPPSLTPRPATADRADEHNKGKNKGSNNNHADNKNNLDAIWNVWTSEVPTHVTVKVAMVDALASTLQQSLQCWIIVIGSSGAVSDLDFQIEIP